MEEVDRQLITQMIAEDTYHLEDRIHLKFDHSSERSLYEAQDQAWRAETTYRHHLDEDGEELPHEEVERALMRVLRARLIVFLDETINF